MMHPLLQGLVTGARHVLLGRIHANLLARWAQDSTHWTFSRLLVNPGFSGPIVFVHAFVRTTAGSFWEPGMAGGRDEFLAATHLPRQSI
jgi:hypothetical protein